MMTYIKICFSNYNENDNIVDTIAIILKCSVRIVA